MNLILRILIGALAGYLIAASGISWATYALTLAKDIISQFIFFIVPFLVIFFIASGIAGLNTTGQSSGKILYQTVGLSYLSTIIAGSGALCIGLWLLPTLMQGVSFAELGTIKESEEVLLNLGLENPFNIFSALLLAFILGIGCMYTQSKAIESIIHEGKTIIEKVIRNLVIPALPLYIGGSICQMVHNGVFETIFTKSAIIFAVILACHWLWLCISYTISGIICKKSPLKMLANMLPAYFTACGTLSSAATIPMSLKCSQANGVSDNTANFVIPLCANIHLSGSVITLTLCSLTVMSTMGTEMDLSFWSLFPFILTLGIVMIATPGAPGGGVMSSLGVLASMLHFGSPEIAIMITLYILQDGFGTACNIVGDGAIAHLMDRQTQSEVSPDTDQETISVSSVK